MPIRQDPISASVTPSLMEAFVRTVSTARWGTYLTAAGFDEKTAVHLYLWNAALGQSFHFPLQAVEIALRNVISQVIKGEFGNDWWNTLSCRDFLGPKRCAVIDKATHRFQEKYGIDPQGDQVVASLTLGFWASMLNRDCNNWLWDEYVGVAFPRLRRGEDIRSVSQIANNIQDLRNRIFHHEPLIKINISAAYADIIKMLGWICPETREWVRGHASVLKLMRERPRREISN